MRKILALVLVGLLAANSFAQTPAGISLQTGYEASDIVENVAFDRTVAIDLTALTVAVDNGIALSIGENTIPIADGLAIAKGAHGLEIKSTTTLKTKFEFRGKLSGTVSISSDTVYQVYLDGVEIEGTQGPAINLSSKKTAFIVLAEGSANTLSDTSNRIKELDEKGALNGKGRIVVSGSGSLNVSGNYKHAIYAKEYVRIRSGSLNVSVSARDGIRADRGFYFDGGNLSITGTGSTIDEESKGIKVDGTESAPGKGKIFINGGTISIRTVGKGITAGWDIDEDATTPDTADDPDPDVIINGGAIEVVTTGNPYEKTDSSGKIVSCSPEGIEAKSDLIINGGKISIQTADDCLNAGNSIQIKGGDIVVKSSANDAIDSNGTLSISGGTIVAVGSGGPEGAFDCDTNTFAISGGTLIGFGGTTSGPTASASTQNALVAGNFKAGAVFIIKDKAGTSIYSGNIPQDSRSAQTMVFSSPSLRTGTEYSIYIDGSAAATFTPQNGVTQIGGSIFGLGRGGMPSPGGFGGARPGDARPNDGRTPPAGWAPPEGFAPQDDVTPHDFVAPPDGTSAATPQ